MRNDPYFPNSILFPCKDCADRQVGCHSTCEKYLAARQKQNDITETAYVNRMKYNELNRYDIERTRKIRKKQK